MRATNWKRLILVAALVAPIATATASGGGGGGGGGGSAGGGSSEDQKVFAAAQAAIDKRDWDGSISILSAYVKVQPGSADAFNLLGYSSRNKGDLDSAFRYYEKALAIDPKHRGAHEYLGEAYLMSGNLAKAQEHLAILDKLCWLPCTEFTELKTAISTYQAKGQ